MGFFTLGNWKYKNSFLITRQNDANIKETKNTKGVSNNDRRTNGDKTADTGVNHQGVP